MPNFLIIGAAKAGTTALASYMRQHPQIYMSPIKETNFFSFEGESLDFAGKLADGYRSGILTEINSYQDQFKDVKSEIAIGEACPSYLYVPKASERIQHYIPETKLIVILRDPIERAYSNFLHHIRDRLETCQTFAEALSQEQVRIQNNWWWGFHYTQAGLYFQQLNRYFEKFQPSQFKIYLYEDLNHQETVLKDIFSFLGVDETFTPDTSVRPNKTGVPANKTLDFLIKESNPIKTIYQQLFPSKLRQQLTKKLSSRNRLVKPTLTPEVRQQLIPVFKEDILNLQNLIQRDLSAWLESTKTH